MTEEEIHTVTKNLQMGDGSIDNNGQFVEKQGISYWACNGGKYQLADAPCRA